ncbi:MAG: flagellar biosynthetic protein FliO [Chitinivibrionia bacterium]|nr:flagellar biosynthetic protein FliO [Chitinivibrionia bacterium]
MKKFLIIFLFAFAIFAQSDAQQDVDAELDKKADAIREVYDDPAAAMTPDDETFGAKESDNWGILMLKVIGWLSLVLAMIAAVAWGVRKSGIFGQTAALAASQTPSMSVLEALSTGQNGVILLVRCEKQVFMIGQTLTKYTLLKELDEDAAAKIIESRIESDNVATFKNSLSKFMQNIKVQKVNENRNI